MPHASSDPGAALVPPSPPATCLIGQRPHPAFPGLAICDHHLQELGQLLRRIEDEVSILSTAPSLAVSYDRKAGRPPAEQAPLNLDVVAFTDPRTNLVPSTPRPATPRQQPKRSGPWCLFCNHESCSDWRAGRNRDHHDDEQDVGSSRLLSALATLHSWANNVREDRGLTPDGAPTLTGERHLLTRQLDWIAQQPWVDDFHDELKTLARQLQRANQTLETPVGTCGTLQPGGALCDGKVWHVLIRPDGKVMRAHHVQPAHDDEPGFRCSTCRRVWTGTDAVRKRADMWIDEQNRKAEAATR